MVFSDAPDESPLSQLAKPRRIGIERSIKDYRAELASPSNELGEATIDLLCRVFQRTKVEHELDGPCSTALIIRLIDSFTSVYLERNRKPICLVELLEWFGDNAEAVKRIVPHLNQKTLLPERVGDYKIETVLKCGSQGVLVSATSNANAAVVMKVCLSRSAAAETLHREARIFAKLDSATRRGHRFLLGGVTFVPCQSSGYCGLAMEPVNGKQIGEWTTASWRELARIGVELCEVLSYVHSKKIFHLDISPGNILLEPAEAPASPVLIDFGFSWQYENFNIAADPNIGRTGYGTKGFAAPEVIAGLPKFQSDVFSLGKLLQNRLVASNLEHTSGFGQIVLTIANIIEGRAKFDRVLRRAADPDIDVRYESPKAFGEALRSCLRRRSILKASSAIVSLILCLSVAFAVHAAYFSGRGSTALLGKDTWVDAIAYRNGLELSSIKKEDFTLGTNFTATFLGDLPKSGFVTVEPDPALIDFVGGIEGKVGDGNWKTLPFDNGLLLMTVNDDEIADNQIISLKIDSQRGVAEGQRVIGPFTYLLDLASLRSKEIDGLLESMDAFTTDADGSSWITFDDGWKPTSRLLENASKIDTIIVYQHYDPYSEHVDLAGLSLKSLKHQDHPATRVHGWLNNIPKKYANRPQLFFRIRFNLTTESVIRVAYGGPDPLAEMAAFKKRQLAADVIVVANDGKQLRWSEDFFTELSPMIMMVTISSPEFGRPKTISVAGKMGPGPNGYFGYMKPSRNDLIDDLVAATKEVLPYCKTHVSVTCDFVDGSQSDVANLPLVPEDGSVLNFEDADTDERETPATKGRFGGGGML